MQLQESGGEGGIRTPGTGFSQYNGLANRRLQPLGHLSGVLLSTVYHQSVKSCWPIAGHDLTAQHGLDVLKGVFRVVVLSSDRAEHAANVDGANFAHTQITE